MALITALSSEGKLLTTLNTLHCSESAFSKLVQGVVGRSRLVQALSSDPATQRSLESEDAARLLEVLDEMVSLQSTFDGPIAWDRTELLQRCLLIRRLNKAALELGDTSYSQMAETVTQQIK